MTKPPASPTIIMTIIFRMHSEAQPSIGKEAATVNLLQDHAYKVFATIRAQEMCLFINFLLKIN